MRRNRTATLNNRNSAAPAAPSVEKPDALAPADPGAPLDHAPFVNGKDKSKTPSARDKTKDDALSFWDFTAGLGDRWTSGDLRTYIYRVWPRVDTQQEHVYITIVQQPVDEEYLLRNFGSGRYLVMVKDRGKLLRKHTASVHNRDYPPRVSASEVVDDPVNDAYFKAWTNNKASAADRQGNNKGEPLKGETAEILNTVFERGAKVDPQLIELWKHTAEQRDAMAKTLSEKQNAPLPPAAKDSAVDLANLLTALKTIMPTPGPAAQQLDAATLLQLAKALQPPAPPPQPNPLQLLEQAKALFSQPAAAPQQDDLASVDRLLSIADKLAALRGSGGAGGRRTGWDTAADFARELVPPLMPYLAGLFGQRGAAPAPGAAPGAAAAPPMPVAFDPYRDPAAMRQHAQNVNGHAAAQAAAAAARPGSPTPPPPATGQPAGAAGAPSNDLVAALQQYGSLVVQALNSGCPGYDFADHIVGLLGNATHALIAAHGEDGLVRAMMAIPEIGLFGEQRLRTFSREFLNFEEYFDEAAQQGEPAGRKREAVA